MSLAYSEDNNKLNFFGIMDNARGYELHLKELDKIYKTNSIKKQDSFNTLNERILRTRNVNRQAVRKQDVKLVKIENSNMYNNLKKVNTRATKFPPYNYKMPTGICRYNYDQKSKLNNSDSKSQASRKSINSKQSIRTTKSRDSLKSVNSIQSKGSKNLSNSGGLKNNLMQKAGLTPSKSGLNSSKGGLLGGIKSSKPDINKSTSRNKLGMSTGNFNKDNVSNRSGTSSVNRKGSTLTKTCHNLFQKTAETPTKNEPKFFFHAKKRNLEKEEIKLENKRLGNSIIKTKSAIPKTAD